MAVNPSSQLKTGASLGFGLAVVLEFVTFVSAEVLVFPKSGEVSSPEL